MGIQRHQHSRNPLGYDTQATPRGRRQYSHLRADVLLNSACEDINCFGRRSTFRKEVRHIAPRLAVGEFLGGHRHFIMGFGVHQAYVWVPPVALTQESEQVPIFARVQRAGRPLSYLSPCLVDVAHAITLERVDMPP